MRAVLAAAGSRGDVLPFATLAVAMAARGHDVTLLTHQSLLPTLPLAIPHAGLGPASSTGPASSAGHVGSAGAYGAAGASGSAMPGRIETVGIPSDPGALLSGPAGAALRRASPRALNRSRHLFADFVHSFAAPTSAVLSGADVLIASTFALASVDVALRAGVPVVRAHQWPEFPWLGGPMPLLPYSWRLPDLARRAARRALRRVEGYLGGLDGWWQGGRLHLVPHHPVGLTTTTLGTLHAYSPLVVPPGLGGFAIPPVCVSGWWVTKAPPALSPGTAALLSATGAPTSQPLPWVYVGFGSMHQDAPERLLAQVARACRRVGVRAIVQLPNAPARPPAEVVCVGPEPHEELFARMAVVVHHGGSGTTGAAVRAGVPSVVVPHFADQFYWGHRLHALGVAPRPLPRALLTGDRLAGRLTEAMGPRHRERARALGARVRAEDGGSTAVDYVERLLQRHASTNESPTDPATKHHRSRPGTATRCAGDRSG